MGSAEIGNRLNLKYNRSQEESADILALEYLKKLKLPTNGLLEIMNYFQGQNIGLEKLIDPYELTHPITSSRIRLIKNHAIKYKFANAKFEKKIIKKFLRSRAKLNGFLNDIDSILKLKNNKFDEYSQIEKSIAYFRKNDFEKSFKIIDDIIKTNPQDGFLFELKAEFLFNQNRIYEAIFNYKKSLNYIKNDQSKILVQIAFANAILELKTNDKYLINLAIDNLQKSLKYEDENALIYKSLSSAYALDNNPGMALLMLAEYSYLINEDDKVKKFAKEAIVEFKKSHNEVGKLRAQDLLEIVKNKEKN